MTETETMATAGGRPLPAAEITLRTGGPAPAVRLAVSVAVVVGALLTAATAAIHLHLWFTGYRHIATVGPLFLLQAVGGFIVSVVVVFWRRSLVAAGAALFLLGTAGGLVLSTQVGLFGFKDSFGAPYAGMALTLEITGAVLLTVAAVLLRPRRQG